MRSDLVFLANRHVQNRFLLCHWVRVASRRFHKTGDPIQETISKVLGLVTLQNSVPGAALETVSAYGGLTSAMLRAPAKSSVGIRLPDEPIRNVG